MNEFERIDDLQRRGFKIIQNTKLFCFGTDAVLLAHFAKIKKNDRIVDLGTGNGIIPLILLSLYDDIYVTGIEIQQKSAELAVRNMELNGLGDNMNIILGDIKNVRSMFKAGEREVVISNPPYTPEGSIIKNESIEKRIARHEILIDLNSIIDAAAYILKFGGRFYMVHRPERMIEIFNTMQEYGIEPKRLQCIQHSAGREPSLILIEGVKGGKPGLKVMTAFNLYDESGKHSREYTDLYFG